MHILYVASKRWLFEKSRIHRKSKEMPKKIVKSKKFGTGMRERKDNERCKTYKGVDDED